LLPGAMAKPFFGPALDPLLSSKILVELPPAVEWPVCDDCECACATRPILFVDGKPIAACGLDRASDTPLEDHDLRTFEIDIEALIRAIGVSSGFPQQQHREIRQGVWFLGTVAEQHAVFITPMRSVVDDPTLHRALHAAAPQGTATLLGPSVNGASWTRFADAKISYVVAEEAFTDDGFKLDLGRLLPVSTKPRLILERGSRRATFDGRGTVLSQRAFELAVLLCKAVLEGRVVVTHDEIEKIIFSGQSADRLPSSDAIRDLRKQLGPLLKGNRTTNSIKNLIQNKPSVGYVLNLAASEILIL